MKKSRINKYINLEASEESDETESEDIDTITETRTTFRYDDIARKIEEKYAHYDQDEDFDEEQEDENEEIIQSQANFIPRKSSPRLFLVKVKYGKEKEIALRILNNLNKNLYSSSKDGNNNNVYNSNNNNSPTICSVIAKDGLKGYIYIEAFHKQHVLDSFDKLRGINKSKISIVPQNEMIEALTFKTNFNHVEFGRIRKGKYKNDLVQIIENKDEMVKIRVMPRINGIKKLFNPNEYKHVSDGKNGYNHYDMEQNETKQEVTKIGKNTYMYKKDIYINGYLIKEVLRQSLNFDVEPNFEELEQFNIKKVFDVGDKIKVVRGELTGLCGVVVGFTNGIATIDVKDGNIGIDCVDRKGNNNEIKSDDFKGIGNLVNKTTNLSNLNNTKSSHNISSSNTFEVPSNALDKYFDIGEEVCYGSENGIITNIKDNLYFVAIKNFTEEVAVTIDQLSRPIPPSKEHVRKEKTKPIIKRDRLINRQVQIKKGQYKGYIGIVKDVYMNKCRIQISSNLKCVSINKEDLEEITHEYDTNTETDIGTFSKMKYSSAVTKTPAYDLDMPVNYKEYNFNEEIGNKEVEYSNRDSNSGEFNNTNDDYNFEGALIYTNNKLITVNYMQGNDFITEDGTFNKQQVNYIRPEKEDTVVIMEGTERGHSAIVLDVQDGSDNCVIKILNKGIKNYGVKYLTKKNV